MLRRLRRRYFCDEKLLRPFVVVSLALHLFWSSHLMLFSCFVFLIPSKVIINDSILCCLSCHEWMNDKNVKIPLIVKFIMHFSSWVWKHEQRVLNWYPLDLPAVGDVCILMTKGRIKGEIINNGIILVQNTFHAFIHWFIPVFMQKTGSKNWATFVFRMPVVLWSLTTNCRKANWGSFTWNANVSFHTGLNPGVENKKKRKKRIQNIIKSNKSNKSVK